MRTKLVLSFRLLWLIALVVTLTLLADRLKADTGTCFGRMITLPFTDVARSNVFFCSIAEAFFSGLTNGTSPTTYSPSDPVTREQMAAFVTRTLDQSLRRGNTRAALGEWCTSINPHGMTFSGIDGNNPQFLACDGQTVWVSYTQSNTVVRYDIRTDQRICILTDIPSPQKIVIVSGRVFVASFQSPGRIYESYLRTTTNGVLSPLSVTVGDNPIGITWSGLHLWTANAGTAPGNGSISSVFLSFGESVDTFTQGFSQPVGILFEGINLWVTDRGDASLKRVDPNNGTVLQTIPLSGIVGLPVFDGTNLWIPCASPDQVYVVRGEGALTGTVLAQLTGIGLEGPTQAAFDGERICVSNSAGHTVSLWKASDLTPFAVVGIDDTNTYQPRGICSDGQSFFVGIRHTTTANGGIIRF